MKLKIRQYCVDRKQTDQVLASLLDNTHNQVVRCIIQKRTTQILPYILINHLGNLLNLFYDYYYFFPVNFTQAPLRPWHTLNSYDGTTPTAKFTLMCYNVLCERYATRQVYTELFWIMHPTRQLGALSKRDIHILMIWKLIIIYKMNNI